jgi:hypothetical protein
VGQVFPGKTLLVAYFYMFKLLFLIFQLGFGKTVNVPLMNIFVLHV